MKKYRLVIIFMILLLVSFIITMSISLKAINDVNQNNHHEMAKVIAGKTYNDIELRLKSLMVHGKTFAHTQALVDLLEHEEEYEQKQISQKIQAGFSGFVKNYDVDSVFFVSDKTKNCYTNEGFERVIKPETQDKWYKQFIASKEETAFFIEPAKDSAQDRKVYLNVRITGTDGSLSGAAGISLKMKDLQKMMSDAQEDYGIQLGLADKDGAVLWASGGGNLDNNTLKQISSERSKKGYQYRENAGGYVITKYIEELGCHLVITKDSKETNKLFADTVFQYVLVIIVSFSLIYILSFFLVRKGSSVMAKNVSLYSYGNLASVYESMEVIDLQKNTIHEVYSDTESTKYMFHDSDSAMEAMLSRIEEFTEEEYKEEMLDFIRFDRVAEQLQHKKTISKEFLSKDMGWCRARFIRIYDDKTDSVPQMIFAIEWIDEEKREQERLRQQKEEAQQASIAKGRFLANMSHEIRTPINAVLGLDTMILRESTEPKIREYAQDIENAGQTLLSLVNDILDLSKIESGKMEIIPLEYDFASLIHDVINMITLKADAKNLEVNLVLDEHLPAGLVGDDVRIREILVNLMNNAVKYTEEGSVTLSVSGEVSGDDVLLHFEVADTGIGIKEEDINKLFAEFERIEECRNRNIEGTGLGMSITVRLLSLMDAKLNVKSVYGEGSAFSFDLRQKVYNHDEIGDLKSRLNRRTENYRYIAPYIAPSAHILMADDNSINRKVFCHLLKELKVQIDAASGGKEACNLIREKKYDLIFLDHMMPDMSGVEVLQGMKKNTRHPNGHTPVIMLTANAISGAREEYIRLGFDGYLSKPLDVTKLEHMLDAYLPPDKKEPLEAGKTAEAAVQAGTVKIEEQKKELPDIAGVDWNYALFNLPRADLLKNIAVSFAEEAEDAINRLAESYQELNAADSGHIREKQFKAFRVQVHSMKSTAAMFGANAAASLARILESAAGDNNLARINALMDIFSEEWLCLKEEVDEAFDRTQDDYDGGREFLGREMCLQYLEMLKEAVTGTMDLDTADDILEELSHYAYPSEEKALLEQMAKAVRELDREKILSLIEKWSAIT